MYIRVYNIHLNGLLITRHRSTSRDVGSVTIATVSNANNRRVQNVAAVEFLNITAVNVIGRRLAISQFTDDNSSTQRGRSTRRQTPNMHTSV